MKATVFNLGGGIGVCHFRRGGATYVAEIDMRTLRVLPQSVRMAVDVSKITTKLDATATHQDIVDRAELGIVRFRDRLSMFDPPEDADLSRWRYQAEAAITDLERAIERSEP